MVPEVCDDPCKSISLNPARKRKRFLTAAEFIRLGQVLDEHPANRSQVSAGETTMIRLLILTNSRKNEIMALPWTHVDLDKAEMYAVDGNTGDRRGHLSLSTMEVRPSLPREPDNPCRHIRRYKWSRRERFLSPGETGAWGRFSQRPRARCPRRSPRSVCCC